VDNYLLRLWTKSPFQADVGQLGSKVQFVHEDDVVDGIIKLLEGRHGGAFNVAGDGELTLRESMEAIGVPIRKMPMFAYRLLAKVLWALRVSEAPPGQIAFAVYPWVVSNEKLKRETGWSPRYTAQQAFEVTMSAHGKLPKGGPAPVAEAELSSALLPGR
jgi:nucleoside-diphosphate-sugar epimerase